MSARRAVVTGLGVVAPGGIGAEAFWSLLSGGRTATRPISLFDASGFRSRIAAECDFDAEAEGLTADEARTMDRAEQFAAVCAGQALADSGLDVGAVRPHRFGVSVGSAVGATTALEEAYTGVSRQGRDWVVDSAPHTPGLRSHLVPSGFAAQVARRSGAQGPVTTVSTGCTSGLDAVGHAAALIEEGTADVMLAGATDAPITPITVACFDSIKATTPENDDPAHASRPFDRDRKGFVLGEGAAMFVLEEYRSAVRRGARIYGEVSGFATRCNAYHMTGLRPDGRELAEAARVALGRARADATEVGYVNAHGSGTRQNDRHETAALKLALGAHAYDVPVSSIKSMIGHSLGAIGSLEIAACLLALEHQVVPPTANLRTADPECDLDYVPVTAREARLERVLTVGSGFGGFQSAMVLSKPGSAAA
ncbi:beta-ketoacyl-[acyl-carrier-protein] synthase family protein [Streptomyces sp. NPDC089915]|uniref:beta-ketoacyl-[acyl-carrier-protein] synthase family protein n=1 Tax=Streptomyces sp. NPDC089915 TaxID=3155186 RepID=UPI0034201B53